MTSINALRISRDLGLMACDEQRHWNPERLKIYAADKIRPVTPPEITERYRVAAAYGNTGTSSIGDELRLTIYREVENLYRSRCEREGEPPERFLTVKDIASLAFRVISRMKRNHIDGELRNQFGFTMEDFIKGEYAGEDGRIVPITDEKIIARAHDLITGKAEGLRTHAVYGNAGIVAGTDPENGFTSYLFSMREKFWEPVYGGFVAQGSGSDSANFVLGSYFSENPLLRQDARIDRVDGIIRLLLAVDKASRTNLGVGGYFNIMIFDSKAAEPRNILRQINDHRSKLTTEVIRAHEAGLLPEAAVREVIDGLMFREKDGDWAEQKMWSAVTDRRLFFRFLRGYPAAANDSRPISKGEPA